MGVQTCGLADFQAVAAGVAVLANGVRGGGRLTRGVVASFGVLLRNIAMPTA